MSRTVRIGLAWALGVAAVACCAMLPERMHAQAPDTLPAGQPAESLKRYTLPPAVVTVTRTDQPLSKTPHAVHTVRGDEIKAARPTWGLDEALFTVPGVLIANRYNFSLDQRLSIRGFGARSAFAVRGVKVLLDGIPQTLPDGQGQLTNVELGEVERIDVLRGAASALHGNASGGVISISTDATTPRRFAQELRVTAGAFDRDNRRNWSKWQSHSRVPLGAGGGGARLTVSRLDYEGERDHTAADLRNANARAWLPGPAGWTLAVTADVGDQPVADNPGALTLAELRANRDSAARLNLLRTAGKDVLQAQGGVTLKRGAGDGGEMSVTLFGLTRDLVNPLPQAYITIDRLAWGARASITWPETLAGRRALLTAGLDVQWQRDDRRNYGYAVPNAALTSPDNTPGAVILDQLERVSELGPFVQAALDLSPLTTLTAGVRYDRVRFSARDRHLADGADDSGERVMDAVSGSLGMTVTPTAALTLYANVGTSFETPTTTELANRPTGAGGFNPELDPQTATMVEVGARGTLDGRASWSIAVYQADVRDELISYEVPDPQFPGRRYFRNAGAARHRGLEASGGVTLLRDVDAVVSWTFSDFVYTDYRLGSVDLAGRALPGIPRHSLRLGVRARPALARGAWIDVDVTHVSRVTVDDTLATAEPAAAWWMTNARLGWDGSVRGVRVSPFAGLNNVFNRHYVGSVVINAALGRYYEPAPGRNLYLGVSFAADR